MATLCPPPRWGPSAGWEAVPRTISITTPAAAAAAAADPLPPAGGMQVEEVFVIVFMLLAASFHGYLIGVVTQVRRPAP